MIKSCGVAEFLSPHFLHQSKERSKSETGQKPDRIGQHGDAPHKEISYRITRHHPQILNN